MPTTGLGALRVLRLLRIVNRIESMAEMVRALMAALPGMGSVCMLMLFFIAFFSIFGLARPPWPPCTRRPPGLRRCGAGCSLEIRASAERFGRSAPPSPFLSAGSRCGPGS